MTRGDGRAPETRTGSRRSRTDKAHCRAADGRPGHGGPVAATRAAAYNRFADRIEAAHASSPDPWARSRAIGEAYVAFAFDEPAAYKLIFAYEQDEADKTDELRAAERRSQRTLTRYVTEMVAAGLLEGDPEILAHVYWAALHGLVVLQMANKLTRAPSFEAIRHASNRLITRGALPVDKAEGRPPTRKPHEI